jgi:hypothetical protein
MTITVELGPSLTLLIALLPAMGAGMGWMARGARDHVAGAGKRERSRHDNSHS